MTVVFYGVNSSTVLVLQDTAVSGDEVIDPEVLILSDIGLLLIEFM